ncbi:G-protein coupled receptor family C group 6 member A-like [Acipenser ruthenus]|uniref:G-protein coupled receptor family C group 6 member A-like n=1 Tax=Acipenser ruthenus TaxID=7906 RepID=UPI002741AF1C|nr:G-protein coupled receptor family C group 6 member A-like [Acipenser ruthenus]
MKAILGFLILPMLYHNSTTLSPVCDIADALNGASAKGDIIIGGLFHLHTQVESITNSTMLDLKCIKFDVFAFLQSQVMIHTIEMINKSPLLPNVTLGYEIYDTCADPTTAIKTVMRLMDDKSDSAENCIPLKCSYTNYNSTVKAVIGESHSEISIVIAHLLSVPLIPQISYESTSEILSQKTRFPSFLRTIPSDTYQSKAMAELALHLNWISVGAIGSDDEYGKYGVESFIDHAQELGLCVPFKEIVPAYMFREESSNHQKKIAEVIKNSSAEAIVLFTKPENVERIIQEAIKHNLTKTWIASDAWAISTKIAQIKGIETVGKIIGITCRRQTVPGFKNYIRNLLANDPPDSNFLRQYKEHYPPCSKKTEPNIQNSLTNTNSKTVNVSQCTDDNFLIQEIDTDIFFGVYLAINAVAQALAKLLRCDSTKCDRDFSFPTWEASNSPLLFLLITLFKLEIHVPMCDT